jgi:hypothetical protein
VRFVAFLAGWLLALAAQAATPVLDAQGVFYNGAKSTNSLALTMSTTNTNRVIVVQVRPVDGTAPSATVTTMTDVAGFTWHRRSGFSGAMANCFSGNTCFSDDEVWWTCATSTLTNDVITITLSKTVNEVMAAGYGVSGTNSCASPWDANPGLPLVINNTTSLDSPMATAFSPPYSPHALLLMLQGQSVNFGPTTGCLNGSILSTDTVHNTCFTVGGCNVDYNWLTNADWAFGGCGASPSSLTAISSICGHTTTNHAWELIVDALAGDATTSCGPGGGSAVVTPQVEVNE